MTFEIFYSKNDSRIPLLHEPNHPVHLLMILQSREMTQSITRTIRLLPSNFSPSCASRLKLLHIITVQNNNGLMQTNIYFCVSQIAVNFHRDVECLS